MKRSLTILLVLVAVFSAYGAIAIGKESPRSTKRGPRDENPKTALDNQNQSIEQQRLELDRQKQLDELMLQKDDLSLKKDQLRVQKSQVVWSALSTVIPLIAVLFTIGYNAWSFRKQTEQLNQQRTQDATLQFELKAAEIAFNGGTPLSVRDRAKALKTMFGNRLSDNFLADYDPSMFGEREGNLDSKKFFLELLLKYPKPEEQYETLCFWKEIFPGDVEWLQRVNLSPHARPTKEPESPVPSEETAGNEKPPLTLTDYADS